MFASGPAFATAGILGARSATLSDSKGGATGVVATFKVTPGTSFLIKGVKFSLCTSPLLSVSCTSPAGATLAAATAGSQLLNAGALTNPYATPTYTSTTDVCFTNATGNTFNGSTDTFTFPLQVVTIPTAINTEFYFREQTFSTADCTTTSKDFGGIAESTSQQLAVTAVVQEDLTFCIGVTITSACGTVGSGAVPLTPNIMSTAAISSATAKMAASTNATSGYSITYNGTTFTDTTSDTITAASSSGVAPNAGGGAAEQFGFTLANQTSGALTGVCAAPSGGSGTATAPYAADNQIAYNTAGAIAVASAAGPSAFTTYTICYGANVMSTTKPGAYTANQTFIATGTF